jgi:hypothetical protein
LCRHNLCVEVTGVDSRRVTSCRNNGFRCDQLCLEDTSNAGLAQFLGVTGNAATISVRAAVGRSMLTSGCSYPYGVVKHLGHTWFVNGTNKGSYRVKYCSNQVSFKVH